MDKPEFPILYISEKDVGAFGSMESASIVGAPFIDRECWKEKTIIDKNGQLFEIPNVEVLGNASWWPHLLTLKPRRIYKVKYYFVSGETLELTEIKDIVMSKLRSARAPWKYIESCGSVEEIINAVGLES